MRNFSFLYHKSGIKISLLRLLTYTSNVKIKVFMRNIGSRITNQKLKTVMDRINDLYLWSPVRSSSRAENRERGKRSVLRPPVLNHPFCILLNFKWGYGYW